MSNFRALSQTISPTSLTISVENRCWDWGELYLGQTSSTKTGKLCQYWNVTYPNLPNYSPTGSRKMSNFCMNDNDI